MNQPNSTPMQAPPERLKPCEHMVNLISRRSDGSLVGPARWYTDFHVLTCPDCREALEGLRNLLEQVRVISDAGERSPSFLLSEDEWQRIHAAWDDEEQPQ